MNWLIYALLSALAASFVGIFGKMGVQKMDSSVATAIRSVVMTVFLLGVVSVMGLWAKAKDLNGHAFLAIVLSGVAGALSWLFYFKALGVGTVSKVAPIDKLSMPLAIVLAVIILGDRPTWINWAGILLISGGAYLAALPAK